MLIFSVSFQFYRMRRLLHRSIPEKQAFATSMCGERIELATYSVLDRREPTTPPEPVLVKHQKEPQAGFEPTTFRLLSECSTPKLLWHSIVYNLPR